VKIASSPDAGRFAPGATIVRRDIIHGRVWGATPARVISDTRQAMLVAYWPGVQVLSPLSYVESQQAGLPDGRLRMIRELAAGTCEVGSRTWQDTTVLTRIDRGEHFSVSRFFGADHEPGIWYVNFEQPALRTSIGYDTCDLCIDLVVAPDLSSYRWKDEDEYELGRQVGFIEDALHARIERARERALTLLANRQGPYATDWSAWQRNPSWTLPALPADALTVPVAARGG
jgi:hypothetical protein